MQRTIKIKRMKIRTRLIKIKIKIPTRKLLMKMNWRILPKKKSSQPLILQVKNPPTGKKVTTQVRNRPRKTGPSSCKKNPLSKITLFLIARVTFKSRKPKKMNKNKKQRHTKVPRETLKLSSSLQTKTIKCLFLTSFRGSYRKLGGLIIKLWSLKMYKSK
jgi:hypothetical protein